jgi:hypothetical protein
MFNAKTIPLYEIMMRFVNCGYYVASNNKLRETNVWDSNRYGRVLERELQFVSRRISCCLRDDWHPHYRTATAT